MSNQPIHFDPYASHLPILAWAGSLPETKLCRPLEIGTGFYSTALIQAIGGHSVETEESYGNIIKTVFPKVQLLNNYQSERWYSFIFIDSCPEASRIEFVKKFRYLSDLFILHDAVSEWEPAYKYNEIKPMFNFNKVVGLHPQTLILSDRPIRYEGL